tara:strand:+ start:990 stop:1277 length:288 start_codon:yes stop_codon:yes gene_type:complete
MDDVSQIDSEIVGRTIVAVRAMTQHEIYMLNWDEYAGMEGDAVVIELDNGALLVPSRDAELNGGGQLLQFVPSDHPDDQPDGFIILHMFAERNDQ